MCVWGEGFVSKCFTEVRGGSRSQTYNVWSTYPANCIYQSPFEYLVVVKGISGGIPLLPLKSPLFLYHISPEPKKLKRGKLCQLLVNQRGAGSRTQFLTRNPELCGKLLGGHRIPGQPGTERDKGSRTGQDGGAGKCCARLFPCPH